MKKRPSILAALAMCVASILVALAAAATPALADDYGYTIRVFPGNRGTLPDNQDPVKVEVKKGDNVNLYDIATATITDDKYVQTGFRLSGTDKLYAGDGQIPGGISEDMDFVVAYGVKANTVPYTIKYVEYQTGRELAEAKTYYGTVGDKPVASYEYIEGYRPLYLAMTGTLSADEENVWTFEYTPLEEGETIVTTTTTTNTTVVTVPGGEETVVNTTTEGGQAATTTTGGTTTTEGTTTTTTPTTTEEGTTTTPATPEGETTENVAPPTQEILDLDTPLAGPDSAGATQDGNKPVGNEATMLSSPAIIAGIGVIAAVAVGLIAYLAKLKKDKANEEEQV